MQLGLDTDGLTEGLSEPLQPLLLTAWESRWEPVRWGLAVQSVLPKGTVGSPQLAALLQEELLSSPQPSRRLVSYVEHALGTRLVLPLQLLPSTLSALHSAPPSCLATLLPLLSAFVPQLAAHPSPGQQGAEWPSQVCQATLQVYSLLLGLALRSARALEEGSGGADHVRCGEGCVGLAAAMLAAGCQPTLLHLAASQWPELHAEAEGTLEALQGYHWDGLGRKRPHGATLDITTLTARARQVFGYPHRYRPPGYDFVHHELQCHSVFFPKKDGTYDYGEGGWRPEGEFTLTVDFWTYDQVLHRTFDNLQGVAQHWYALGLAERLRPSTVLWGMVGALLRAMAEAPHMHSRWADALLLRVPLLLANLEQTWLADAALDYVPGQVARDSLQRLGSSPGLWMAAQAAQPDAWRPNLLCCLASALASHNLVAASSLPELLGTHMPPQWAAEGEGGPTDGEAAALLADSQGLAQLLRHDLWPIASRHRLCRMLLHGKEADDVWGGQQVDGLVERLGQAWLVAAMFACGMAGDLKARLLALLQGGQHDGAYVLLYVLQGEAEGVQLAEGVGPGQAPAWLQQWLHSAVAPTGMDPEVVELARLLGNPHTDTAQLVRETGLGRLVVFGASLGKLCLRQAQHLLVHTQDYRPALQPLLALLTVSLAAFLTACRWLAQETAVAREMGGSSPWPRHTWRHEDYSAELPLPQAALVDVLLLAAEGEHWARLQGLLGYHIGPVLLPQAEPPAPWLALLPAAPRCGSDDHVTGERFRELVHGAICERSMGVATAADLDRAVRTGPADWLAAVLLQEPLRWDYGLECGLAASLGASLLCLAPGGAAAAVDGVLPGVLGGCVHGRHAGVLGALAMRLAALLGQGARQEVCLAAIYQACSHVLAREPATVRAVYAIACLLETACLRPLLPSSPAGPASQGLWAGLRRVGREDLLLAVCSLADSSQAQACAAFACSGAST